jgi:hypothetical protein
VSLPTKIRTGSPTPKLERVLQIPYAAESGFYTSLWAHLRIHKSAYFEKISKNQALDECPRQRNFSITWGKLE